MRHAADDWAQAPPSLPVLYAPIERELRQVEALITDELSNDHPFVNGLIKYGVRLGGKRLRPALVLLSGQAGGRLHRDHLPLAAAVEIIHTATLVHDDVLDEATLRRHMDTVNTRWNNETSVLLGDYLLSHALCLASCVSTTYACRTIGEASRTVCEGELRQIASRGNYALSEQEYIKIITAKTAALTACCCRLGAHYAGASPEHEAALVQYGLDLGVAFQIADDLLDVLGDEATAGKSLGTDLAKQKSTLPLIRALEQAAPDQRANVLAALALSDGARRDALRPWLVRFDAIEYSREKAGWYGGRACEALAALPDSPAHDAMLDLTRFVVARQH